MKLKLKDKDKVVYIKKYGGSKGGVLYFLGVIGALFYFIPKAVTFGAGVLAFLKSLVWPAILVFKLFEFLKI